MHVAKKYLLLTAGIVWAVSYTHLEQKQTKHCKGILQWRAFYKIDARKKREMGGSMTKGMYGAFGGQDVYKRQIYYELRPLSIWHIPPHSSSRPVWW